MDVYTRRATVQGYRFGPDTPAQREMEEAFPYQETPDQLSAIADVKADMQSAKPMDRLVCGDVGFGKTEVALRAAFKCARRTGSSVPWCSGPHHHPRAAALHQTVKARCEPFPRARGGALAASARPPSRPRRSKGSQEGDVDILVGTHRLLSQAT